MKKQEVIEQMERMVKEMIEQNITPTPRLLVWRYMCRKGKLTPARERGKLYKWADEVLG